MTNAHLFKEQENDALTFRENNNSNNDKVTVLNISHQDKSLKPVTVRS